jgi:hypothetical protein
MESFINFKAYSPKIRAVSSQQQVFDPIRQKWVALTPEEWVRQHFINYLVDIKGYSAGLLAIEHPIVLNGMQQRVDIVVFNRSAVPIMVVECKAPSVTLTRETYEQAARYNLKLRAMYLVVTNGISYFCSKIEGNKFFPLSDIPTLSEIE